MIKPEELIRGGVYVRCPLCLHCNHFDVDNCAVAPSKTKPADTEE